MSEFVRIARVVASPDDSSRSLEAEVELQNSIREIERLKTLVSTQAKAQEYSQSLIAELKGNLQSTQHAYDQLRGKMENFNAMYDRQLEVLEKLQSENEGMHKKLATLSEREANKYRAQLAKEKKGFEDILSSYESRLELKTNKYNDLQMKLESLCRQLEDYRQVREENAKLMEENTSLTATLASTSQCLSERELEFRTKMEEMATKIKTLQEISEAYETTVSVTSKEYEHVVEEAVVQHQQEENELEALKSEFKHYKMKRSHEIADLVRENMKLLSEIESYKRMDSALQSEINLYRNQLHQTTLKVKELMGAQIALETTVQSHLSKYQESEANWRHSQMENYLLKEELDVLRKKGDEESNSTKIEQLEELVKKLSEECQSLHRKLGEVAEAKLDIEANVRPELENLAMHSLKAKLHKTQSEVEELKHELHLIQDENSRLHERLHEAPTRDAYDKKRDKVKALKATLTISDRTIADLKTEVDALLLSNKSLEWQFRNMSELKEQLDKDVGVLSSRLQVEAEEKERLEKRCEELIAITKDIVPKLRDYEDIIAGLNREKEELLSQAKQGTQKFTILPSGIKRA